MGSTVMTTPIMHPYLGSKPLQTPALAGTGVSSALVQPVVSVLPELDRVGLEQVATPVRRARHVAVVRAQEPLGLALDRRQIGDRLALPRSGRGGPAARRPRRPVRVRLLRRELPHRPLDANLPAQGLPVE